MHNGKPSLQKAVANRKLRFLFPAFHVTDSCWFSLRRAPNPRFNKSFNRIMVADSGGWWRIVIDYAAKSAEFFAGEGERGAIPTSASKLLMISIL